MLPSASSDPSLQPQSQGVRQLSLNPDLLKARGHRSTESVVGNNACPGWCSSEKTFRHRDVSIKPLLTEFHVLVNPRARAQEILAKGVVEVVRVRDWHRYLAQRALYKIDPLRDIEQSCQCPGRSDQPWPLLQTRESAFPSKSSGDAKLSRTGSYVNHRSDMEVVEPPGDTGRNGERGPMFAGRQPDLLWQKSIEVAIVRAFARPERIRNLRQPRSAGDPVHRRQVVVAEMAVWEGQ